MKKKLLLTFSTAIFFTSSFAKNFTEAEILDKAESATGVRVSELKIISGSVSNTAESKFSGTVKFRVLDKNNNEYKCYFTYSEGPYSSVSSDALCTKLGGSPANNGKSNPSCNALLEAAGRC